ncbi:MAG: potassium transporter [Francisellaceae bacterium]|jgi:trk system potassium uptake protein|nr:potassium transporter [Francisellaceae bacterium]
MKIFTSAKITGILLIFFSISMLTPIIPGVYFEDNNAMPFIISWLITFITGLILWFPNREYQVELRTRDGFLIVFITWIVLSVFGSLPFVLSYQPHIDLSKGVFEAISGLTTTGASTLIGVDILPKSVLYYRQQLQFLGGMGIIVLAVAIMPLIGVGGMQLYKAEIAGPMKEAKITPRITQTAKLLWIVYILLTIISIIAYYAAGMSWFDAICYGFASISTGGYSPHDASIAYFNSKPIYWLCILFMLLGGVNFSLHYLGLFKGKYKVYWRNLECRHFIMSVIVITIITIFILYYYKVDLQAHWIILDALFQVVSFATTTGFVSDNNYYQWPSIMPILLLLIGTVGSCSGSTTGGVKFIRAMLVRRQITREIKQLIHPSGQFIVKIYNEPVPDRVMSGVWSFISASIAIFVFLLLLLILVNPIDLITATSALIACMANIGPGLGKVHETFEILSDPQLWILSFAMLVGRLEIFTLLVLLSPSFWRD